MTSKNINLNFLDCPLQIQQADICIDKYKRKDMYSMQWTPSKLYTLTQ